VHIQPNRVRAAMVITSAYNLGEILKQQTMATKNSKTLLNKMRAETIYMKLLNIQTLGVMDCVRLQIEAAPLSNSPPRTKKI
jgi:hypothetical protein